MAVGTLPERQARVPRFVVRAWSMAHFASYLRMQSREREARLGVIKLLGIDRLPLGRVVALRAVIAESALVCVLVTAGTGWRKPQKGVVEIFNFNAAAFRRLNLGRGMTSPAR